MIDAQAPTHPLGSFRDLAVHIATIVLGLLIAVGIEQAVEHLHERHQIAQTREALRLERLDNLALFHRFVHEFGLDAACYQNNMIVLEYLQQHPGTPQEKLPGVLYWGAHRVLFAHSAWSAAQQGTVLQLMPAKELARDQALYKALQDITDLNDERWIAINNATRFALQDHDPSHMTPAQVAEEIELLKLVMMKHYLQGDAMEKEDSIGEVDPDFTPGPSAEQMNALMHNPNAAERSRLAEALAMTQQRLKAAGYGAEEANRQAAEGAGDVK